MSDIEIKTKPTPGYRYKVVRGDRLDDIETTAYGSIKGLIEGANPQIIKNVTSLENRPTIYSGNILFIPELPEIKELSQKITLSKKEDNELTIVIGNREIVTNNARIIKTIDTAAHGWTANVSWVPGQDADFDKLLKPFSYPHSKAYIGNELLISGALYGVSPSFSKDGGNVDLEGYSYAADIIDSVCTAPYEVSKSTLQQRANQLLANTGIRAIFNNEAGGAFDRITADRNDKIFDHLLSLAAQRGLLITSSNDGNIVFMKADTTSPPVGTIEDKNGLMGISAKFDGRSMYNSITVYGESPGNPVKTSTITDSSIPKSRFFAFSSDDSTDGDIENAAKWKRAQIYADALTFTLPVIGWYAPNGKLWKENTNVVVVSPYIFAEKGFTFLIKQVEFVLENSGRTAILSLIPPLGEDIILPWS
jgi:hypothetical protein